MAKLNFKKCARSNVTKSIRNGFDKLCRRKLGWQLLINKKRVISSVNLPIPWNSNKMSNSDCDNKTFRRNHIINWHWISTCVRRLASGKSLIESRRVFTTTYCFASKELINAEMCLGCLSTYTNFPPAPLNLIYHVGIRWLMWHENRFSCRGGSDAIGAEERRALRRFIGHSIWGWISGVVLPARRYSVRHATTLHEMANLAAMIDFWQY